MSVRFSETETELLISRNNESKRGSGEWWRVADIQPSVFISSRPWCPFLLTPPTCMECYIHQHPHLFHISIKEVADNTLKICPLYQHRWIWGNLYIINQCVWNKNGFMSIILYRRPSKMGVFNDSCHQNGVKHHDWQLSSDDCWACGHVTGNTTPRLISISPWTTLTLAVNVTSRPEWQCSHPQYFGFAFTQLGERWMRPGIHLYVSDADKNSAGGDWQKNTGHILSGETIAAGVIWVRLHTHKHTPEPPCRAACPPSSDDSSRTQPVLDASSSRGAPWTPPETGSASSGPSHRWSSSCTGGWSSIRSPS